MSYFHGFVFAALFSSRCARFAAALRMKYSVPQALPQVFAMPPAENFMPNSTPQMGHCIFGRFDRASAEYASV
jgi:hypothetical protein